MKVYLDTGRKTEKVKYDSIDISGKFIQVYDDVFPLLSNIKSPCAIHLLFWMLSNMKQYNQISLNKSHRADFIADTQGQYKDQSVKVAIRKLVENHLIVSMSEKGKREAVYFVNPAHFWKTGSQKDRTEAVKGFYYKLKENETN